MVSPSTPPAAAAGPSAPVPWRPSRRVVAVAAATALACVGFAAVNVAFEATDRFSSGPYAAYSTGISVMNWLVVGLKAAGAAMALLSVAPRPRRLPSPALAFGLWAAFATLGVYAVGNVVHVAGMATGLFGSPAQIDLAGLAYVLFFLLFAGGFGVLAVSHTRRHRLRARWAVLGSLGAPLVLAGVLVGAPAALAALGLMPAA
ncbi:hypothetical protein LP52_09040 [Streptomonospora alba]|uniref:Uncharacterized protein n=1 Tax=Streptomonospora alba TaxID=183763 RepID=A0A0C2FJ19_9ACTN|nr:hypothetical protein [Streptomonospora alba]KIH99244.1 hypothetical protein LP52_09040 [Streptomonospora alba]